MLNEKELSEFEYAIKTVGYCRLPIPILAQRESQSLSDELDKLFAGDELASSNEANYQFYDIFHNLFGKTRTFDDLAVTPLLNQCADQILSPTSIIHSYNAVKLMPSRGNNATKIHRDSQRFYSQDYPLMLQALICLDDFTEENGATHVLPGSHHFDEKPTDEYFFQNSVRLTAKAGEVFFFDSMVWHAGGINESSLPRRGITVVYSRSFMKQQIDLPRAFPIEYLESLSEIAKQKIGMNVRVPTSLEEFRLPPDKRLYKPNQG